MAAGGQSTSSDVMNFETLRERNRRRRAQQESSHSQGGAGGADEEVDDSSPVDVLKKDDIRIDD